MKMKTKITILLFLSTLITTAVQGVSLSKLVLHLQNENRSITLRGDQCGGGAVFKYEQTSCVCITGLWAFYRSNCDLAHVLLGATNGQCFHMDFQIQKASLISPPEASVYSSSATAFDQRISSIGGKFFTILGIPPTTYFVPSGHPVVITTGTQSWRIPHKKLCMKPTSLDSTVTNYCLFKHSIYEEYRLIDENCANEDDIVSPLICTPYLKDEGVKLSSCIEVEVVHSQSRRFKRDNARRRRETRQKGRTFLDSVTGLRDNTTNENKTKILEEDENNIMNNNTIDRPLINSEIWNFMTYRAQLQLGIRDPKEPSEKLIGHSPALEFLKLAKEIQQKTCPEHYVPKDHYDIAAGAFESVQKNHMKFMDSFLDAATSARIKDALEICKNNLTAYPFLERVGKKSVSCNGSNPITHGSYEMFDQILELTLGHDQGSRANEPIVETVWKIFIHAHSACYPFFKNNFNDHHRFTTVMLPLFTNAINDMWFSVTELKEDIYSGFLGDAVDLMDSVAYCAMFSRLESGYPWDLPRPKKDNARKKREVNDADPGFECMDDYDARNICPITRDSFPRNLRDSDMGSDELELDSESNIDTSFTMLYTST